MKRNLLKVTLALALLPMGAWAQSSPNFGTEEVVSEETTWVFNDYSIGESTSGINATNKLYNRAVSGRKFTIEAIDEQILVFSDGYTVKVNKKATTLGENNRDYMINITAGASGTATISEKEINLSNQCTPCFAFNASVAGTCYAYVKSDGTNNVRINFGKADGTTALKNGSTSSSDIVEIKYTSDGAGVFFIGGMTKNVLREIYAIRFVPTAKDYDQIVYIGATGYATYGNSGTDVPTLPEGLKAYSAKAAKDGHSVTLTSLGKMRRSQGYVLGGTPNTNYRLTHSGTELSGDYNGGEMVRASSAVTFTVDENGKDNDSKYNYILAADDGVAKFFTVANNSTLASGKAYLKTATQLTPAGPGSRGVSIIFADEATGIEAVTTQQGDGQWYNLQGQKVAQPAKGLFIKNGKKVIIK